MTYRNDLEALSARQAALETEVRDRTRELDQARRLVDEINARARLPVLDNIRVAAPCSASWELMTGDARVRACGDCQKNVYNLSEMTRDEAELLIREKEGRLCVRYFQRADGTILLKDCAVGVKRRRRRRVVAAGVAASLAGAALGLNIHKQGKLDRLREREHMVMGGAMAIDPPPSPVPVVTETQAPVPAPVEPRTVRMGKVSGNVREVKGDVSFEGPMPDHPAPRRAPSK